MSKKGKGRGGQRVWRGLTTVMASLLALVLTAQPLVNSFRTDIDKFLGTSSSVIVHEGDVTPEQLYTYHSDYTSTTELLDAIENLGERMSEEGTVLLKNNGALPLSSDELGKVSLLGFSSYYPVRGGDMGSTFIANTRTDADTVDLVQALQARGFTINTELQDLYEALKPVYTTEVQSWGGTVSYNNITVPSIGSVFTSKEPSQAQMSGQDAGWKDSLASNNIMIVTLARSGSENGTYLPGTAGVDPSQNLNQRDPLGLSNDERDLIQAAVDAKGADGKVIVLLNSSSAMEVQEIQDNAGVDAILQVGLPGGYGFYGVADILSGAANPSGHLADTYASTIANTPAAINFGDFEWTNPDPSTTINSEIVQAEGIYIGYKYFETRYADVVLGQGNAGNWNYDSEVTYPFGYGLSYTTFKQTLASVNVDLAARTVTANVSVTNTGSVPGKDAVELYVSLPYIQGGLEKSAIQLIDFCKTDELAPGETKSYTLTANAQFLASWDSNANNAAGTKGNWVLDAGDYLFTVGNGAHEAVNNVLAAQGASVNGDAGNVQTWTLAARDETSFATTVAGVNVENQLQDMDVNYWLPGTATYMSRSDWQGTFPKTYTNLTATPEMLDIMDNDIYEISADNGDPSSVVFGAQNGLSLADLKGASLDDERWSQLMDQITLEECMIRTGFGGTSTKAIPSIMSPEAIQNDGPNGLYSYPLGQYATKDASTGDPCVVDPSDPNANYKFGTMGNATIIGQTFSKDLAREYGEVAGNYSLWANQPLYWGAAVNLHRVPYNARNHEYYSEDAVIACNLANEFIQAGMKYGCLIAIKHLAFNDTEINRSGVATFMTEQQARENELRAFESVVENGCLGVMTAYNRVGITQDNAHTGLMKNILRGEWGFKGLVTEDFIMDANYTVLKEAVLNGITMSCNTGDNTIEAVAEKYGYWTVENVSKDAQLMAALKQAMTWQNYAIANSNAMDGLAPGSHLENVRTWYDNALTATQAAFAVLTVLCVVMYVRSAKRKDS